MPSDPVYVSFKITAVDELCNDKLLKGGNSARIKSKLFLKDLYKFFWKNHITHTQGGRNGFGEGIEIDHVVLLGKRKEGFLRLCRYRKLGFEVILYNISIASV